ncbi:MAG: 16S rRNA (cytidine(1402)-2'-O)-methyltransferase [Rhodospirillaceae bacterium]|nr:16S rRNA (cytidine(1402)-2'-O)-methyltransferase [Rhodospirillaceae bacterium]MYH37043.1 16S rRNA (cytidine(1402)-2'-O)-methyltransferase [Rhodospirillaceae bacterium]MYK13593.1 16S rRNA (cytidine(1402)-2'-O)-methyltransferase [Rhodospirillaceae bacterium]
MTEPPHKPARDTAREPDAPPLPPGLYPVATPIGNLRDITLRALDTLAQADLVVCEDTRVTGRLLAHFGIAARLRSYNDRNAARQRPAILEALNAGKSVALVSDAGSPLISDPGYRLVVDAIAAGHRVETVPGPTAAIAALQVSGLPTDRFRFVGFLAPKDAKRRRQLAELAGETCTLIFYESGPRLAASLRAMADILGDRPAAVARELTKRYEEVRRGMLAELAAGFDTAPKGEIAVVVGGLADNGAREPGHDADALIRAGLAAGDSVRSIADAVADATGLPRRSVYQRALALSDEALQERGRDPQ